MREKPLTSKLRLAVSIGALFGLLAIYVAAVGILLMMNARWIVVDGLTLGQAVLLVIGLGAGGVTARRGGGVGHAVLAGALAGAMLAVLLFAMATFNLRFIFISLSPPLLVMLRFGLGLAQAMAVLTLAGAALGGAGALLGRSPPALTRPVLMGAAAVAIAGVFQELVQLMMQADGPVSAAREALYSYDGLTPAGAAIVFVVAVVVTLVWRAVRPSIAAATAALPPGRRRALGIARALALLLLVLAFPLLAGNYIGQVLMLVGLSTLMGMGLNLEVGLAGLLDLGFVAFFAVGAYTTALLTADSPQALAAWTFLPALSYWQAMPFAVLASILVGVLFGIPVLGVRGDYLAVATMGLGEIVRVIVLSDMAAPLLGGAAGVLQIPRPALFGYQLNDPVSLFFLTLVFSMVAAYCAWRLENSRLGRAWMALRDDEDVAQALGINLVRAKLLAYGLGAAFAGLAGSIFAVMLGSIYPSSFQLLISINVLALVIVGGMGSLPGVVVGALVLVGLPELLREFGEYRYLFYGVALVLMMRFRPEGLWPSATRRRELRDAAEPIGVVAE